MEKYYRVSDVNEIINKLAKEPAYYHDGEDFYNGVCAVDGELMCLEPVELPRLAVWKHKTSTPGGIRDTYGCTNCGFTTGWTTDFCGGCGAYMRGEFNG